ncbi:MAG: tRNA pseudouridine(55) synthase TruB [Anaerolineae bacterium]
MTKIEWEGILPLNKPKGKTSFSLVSILRKLSGIRKIGHTGTLDPLATGVMVMLIGKSYTRLASVFLEQDKEYLAKICLGASTDTFDSEGRILQTCERIPTLSEITQVLALFQGTVLQMPPMYSAKKIRGKKLYELARKGIEIDRPAVKVEIKLDLLSYQYPYLDVYVICSKGTYVRSIAHDLGSHLGVGAHLTELTRTRLGHFLLKDCLNVSELSREDLIIKPFKELPLNKLSNKGLL